MFKNIKQARIVTAAIVAAGILLSTAACTESGSTDEFGKNPDTVQSVITELNNAQTITLKKDAFSIGDSWTVTVDDTEVATIKGKTFPVWGDTYSMYAPDGTFIAGEQEQKYILTGRTANTYDYKGAAAGSIKAQLFSFMYHFNINNASGEQVGTFKQGLSFTLKGDITNQAGKTEWTMDKAMFSIGATITITDKAGADKHVDAIDAIWTAAIINEVSEAAKKSSSSSSK